MRPFRSQLTRVGVILALSIVAIVAFSIFLVGTITRPLSRVTGLIERLAQGDREISVPYTEKQDEVGKLARALDVFRRQADHAGTADRGTATGRGPQCRVHGRRAAQHRRRFRGAGDGSHYRQFRSSSDMHGTAKSMSDVANQALSQAGSAAAAAAAATSNVESVAAASEELCASISEISRQVAESARISPMPPRKPNASTR